MDDYIVKKLNEYKKYNNRANKIHDLVTNISNLAKTKDIDRLVKIHNMFGGVEQKNTLTALEQIKDIDQLVKDINNVVSKLEKPKDDTECAKLLKIYKNEIKNILPNNKITKK